MPLVRYHIVTYFNMLSVFYIEENGYCIKRATRHTESSSLLQLYLNVDLLAYKIMNQI
ncbi:hypothetical protein J2T15_000649 [Paenibacillus harenae]|uniref:Uncharacterized protein n=1 Tax=Paenibacillus harenae TaxID=306543 RepID=A0ABT9TWX5_PAEHA|nr:hypothetical protein [Paenibacillus harenae]